MKQVVYGIVAGLMVVLTLGIIMAIVGKMTRQSDLDNGFSAAVEHAVETTMNEKTYSIDDNEEFIADFTQNLLIQISNDSDIEIKAAKVDYEKGLMSVKVVEHFKHPNGNDGKNEIETTVVFEQLSAEAKPHTITFLWDDGTLYKEYQIKEGDDVIVPTAPVKDGKIFGGWKIKDTNTVTTDFGKSANDITYVAVFN